jgi:putative ABC transport system permease protein
MKYTGIPINFGMSVVLGFIIGTAIAGQTFFNFTLDNLRYFETLKAMGAGNGPLLHRIILQALMVGVIDSPPFHCGRRDARPALEHLNPTAILF